MRRSVPNFLSLYRVAIALPVILLISHGHWAAAIILLLTGFASDLADGYLARRWESIGAGSNVGARLDVFADRAFIVAPMIGMVVAGDLGPIAIALPLLLLWVIAVYSVDWLAATKTEAANGTLWAISHILTGWQAFEHLPLKTVSLFLAITALLSVIAGLSHRENIKRGLQQAGLDRIDGEPARTRGFRRQDVQRMRPLCEQRMASAGIRGRLCLAPGMIIRK